MTAKKAVKKAVKTTKKTVKPKKVVKKSMQAFLQAYDDYGPWNFVEGNDSLSDYDLPTEFSQEMNGLLEDLNLYGTDISALEDQLEHAQGQMDGVMDAVCELVQDLNFALNGDGGCEDEDPCDGDCCGDSDDDGCDYD